MLGCIQPMSSPMMNRMLGFCGCCGCCCACCCCGWACRCCGCACGCCRCCAAAGMLAAVTTAKEASAPSQMVLIMLFISSTRLPETGRQPAPDSFSEGDEPCPNAFDQRFSA